MEIINYTKKPSELIVEFEDGTRKTFPIEHIEEWANEEGLLIRIRATFDTADYDGSYSERTQEIDFIDFYDCEMNLEDVVEFIEWLNK